MKRGIKQCGQKWRHVQQREERINAEGRRGGREAGVPGLSCCSASARSFSPACSGTHTHTHTHTLSVPHTRSVPHTPCPGPPTPSLYRKRAAQYCCSIICNLRHSNCIVSTGQRVGAAQGVPGATRRVTEAALVLGPGSV
eukprot:3059342-Rhodomonas_salina.1